jgi:hypothetical protein
MLPKLISALMALTAIAELAFYAFKSHTLNFIFGPALSNVGRVDHFIDLQVVTLNGASCQVPLAMIYEKSCYFNQTNIPRLFIAMARIAGLGKESTLSLGFGLGALAIAMIFLAYLLSLRNYRLAIGLAFALQLYPFRLAIERGNIDLIILILLLLAAILASIRPPSILKAGVIGGLFLVGSMGKLYPLLLTPLLIAYCKRCFPGKFSWMAIAGPVLLAALSFCVLLPDISAMLRESYKDVAGGLSYGLGTLVQPNMEGISFLGIKIALISLVASSSSSPVDVFGHQSLAARVHTSLNSDRISNRLSGNLFLMGSMLFLATYIVFINGIYRLSIPFIMIIPAMMNTVPMASPRGSEVLPSATKKEGRSGILFLILIVFSIGMAGFRYYDPGSNLQHYTNLFLNLILMPMAAGIVGSALFQVCFWRGSPPKGRE